jgi:acetylornithine deacetylase/succinyl-diaminopimelate desuccinylase family protein
MKSIENRVLARIDHMTDEIVKRLQGLVQIESINPNYPGVLYDDIVGGEGDAARYLAHIYKEYSSEVDLFAVEPGRENVVASVPGQGGGRSLIFNGHLDVVPPGNASDWQSGLPFSARMEDGRIWGRGTADQKSGLIAQAMALSALAQEGVRLQGDVIVEAVVGEETMEHDKGVSAVIDRGYRADAAVISEATGTPLALAVDNVTAGALWFSVTVRGKTSHVCNRGEMINAGGRGSTVAVNAIEKMIPIIWALQVLEREWAIRKQHPQFKPGHFTIHPGIISGGPAGSAAPGIISDVCTVEYNCWYPPDEDADAVRSEIVDQIRKASRLDSWLTEHTPEVEWKSHWAPAQLYDHPIIDVMKAAHSRVRDDAAEVGNITAGGFGAVCDATFFQQAGIAAVVYGPGSLLLAHSVNEWVLVEQVVTATKAYAIVAMSWCGFES